MTGDVGVDGGTRGHLQNIGRSGNFKSYICSVHKGVMMGRRVASGLWARSGAGADANAWEAMELKMTAGSEMETAGVTGKSKETMGSEAETVVGTESGVDTEAGMDSESTVDWSGG